MAAEEGSCIFGFDDGNNADWRGNFYPICAIGWVTGMATCNQSLALPKDLLASLYITSDLEDKEGMSKPYFVVVCITKD